MGPQAASLWAYVVLVLALLGLVKLHAVWARHIILNLIQIFAVLLMIGARFAIGLRGFHASASTTPGGLVTSGPYRYIRHPIYASVLMFCWAAVLGNLSLAAVILGIVITAAIAVRIRSEEKMLLRDYPAYRGYAAITARIVPGVF